MLQQFTWQQFGIAAGILSAGWYAIVLLLYFRTELTRIGAPRKKDAVPPPPDPTIPPDEESLMGAVKLPEGMESVDEDGLSFGPAPQPGNGYRTKRLGVVSDVMQELKTMVTLLQQENGSKEEFYGLFTHIKNTYPTIRESDQLAALTSYLEDYLPFALTEEEKENLWN